MQNATKKEISKQVEELLNAEFKDFDDNTSLSKLISRQSKKLKTSQWAKQGASLAQAYQLSRQTRASDLRPSPSAVSLKIDSLRHLLEGVVKATYTNPLTTDSEDLKKRRMQEKNYNLRLRKVIDDALAIAVTLYQSNTCKVAGPYPEEQALELSGLIE